MDTMTEESTMQTDQRQEAEAADLIRRARDLIADPDRWVQGSAVRYADHASTVKTGWCAFGALMEVGAIKHPGFDGTLLNDPQSLVQLAMDRAVQILEPDECESYVTFNDSHGHEDVMLMFKYAIGVLEGM